MEVNLFPDNNFSYATIILERRSVLPHNIYFESSVAMIVM